MTVSNAGAEVSENNQCSKNVEHTVGCKKWQETVGRSDRQQVFAKSSKSRFLDHDDNQLRHNTQNQDHQSLSEDQDVNFYSLGRCDTVMQ